MVLADCKDSFLQSVVYDDLSEELAGCDALFTDVFVIKHHNSMQNERKSHFIFVTRTAVILISKFLKFVEGCFYDIDKFFFC